MSEQATNITKLETDELAKAKASNTELLEALERLVFLIDEDLEIDCDELAPARAAIANATRHARKAS